MPLQDIKCMLHVVKSHYKRFRRFSFVGLINTLLDFSVFSLLFYLYGVSYVIAHVVAFLIAVTNSFLLNSLWTFKNLKRDRLVRQIAAFLAVGLVGLALTTATIYLLGQYIPVLLAKLAAVGVSMVWNYLGSWLFVFRE